MRRLAPGLTLHHLTARRVVEEDEEPEEEPAEKRELKRMPTETTKSLAAAGFSLKRASKAEE